jgi:hypothetical protein
MVPHKKRQEYSMEKEIEKEVEEILKGEEADIFAEEESL